MPKWKPGPCVLEVTPKDGVKMEIDTIEGQDTVFSAPYEIVGYKVNHLIGVQEGQYVATEEPTYVCSTYVNPEQLATFTGVYDKGVASGIGFNPIGKDVLFYDVNIHPISEGTSKTMDIIGKKVSCTAKLAIKSAKDATEGTKVDLVFKFSSNPDSAEEDFGMPFTIGAFANA